MTFIESIPELPAVLEDELSVTLAEVTVVDVTVARPPPDVLRSVVKFGDDM